MKIWEISGEEEIFWVWLKMVDRDIKVFALWIPVTP